MRLLWLRACLFVALAGATSGARASAAEASELGDAPRGPVWPVIVSGRVVDENGRGLGGASVVSEGLEIRTSSTGEFWLVAPPSGAPLLVKRPGYGKELIEPSPDPLVVQLWPQHIRAAYLTYYGLIDGRVRSPVIQLVDSTELNALVIDVKGDRGWIPYDTKVPLALEMGAKGPATMRDFDAKIADWKKRGIYLIARIVTFKDDVLARHHPEWAVGNGTVEGLFHDREGLAWLDPFHEEAWEYPLAIAKEAIEKGFDEVQFDYVRFPTEATATGHKFSKPLTQANRIRTISAFLARARRELGPLGAYVSADIFGYTAFNSNDTDIGQRIEELADTVDYLSPMAYPSGYHLGIPGFRNPVAHSYEVVRDTVRGIVKRVGDKPLRIRPWIQDFRDYAFDRRSFGPAEIRDQVRGANEAGSVGWMLWNPANQYHRESLLAAEGSE